MNYEFENRRVLVYGAGKSGLSAARLLLELKARVLLFDGRDVSPEELLKEAEGLEGVEVFTREFPESCLSRLDLVVVSPGVPCDIPDIIRIREAGIPLTGEIELAYQASRGDVLAVTGTNGKTTTTALLGELMKSAGRETYVVGNIGNPYTSEALKMTEHAVTVAEISSFQLETIHDFHPKVSAILNITEDHLNRHHTMEEYIRVKELITLNQTKSDTCVLNYEDPVLRDFGSVCPARVVWFSSKRELPEGFYLKNNKIMMCGGQGREEELFDTAQLKLIGVHNYENVMAACAMAFAAGAGKEAIQRTLAAFKPVAHRIEFIAEKNGVVWYNDSKGTNPDAAIRGICAMSRPTFLIAGGYDKGSDYREWIRSFGNRVRMLVLEGATKFDIRDAALAEGFPEEKIVIKESMREACEYCRAHASCGDAVLLSPACASWGEFPNYEVRGDEFRKFVLTEV